MWRSALLSFIAGTVCLAGTTESPVGTWATQIVGRDKGLCYLTFSNDTTVAGYGISLNRLGAFELAGHWSVDEKGRLVGGFAVLGDVGLGALFRGKVNNSKLRLHVNATQGRFNFKGEPADDIADLSGGWVGQVRTKGSKFFAHWNSTVTGGGWFEIAGMGTSGDGMFDLTGHLLATPDNRLAAHTLSDTGTSTTTAALVGKLIAGGKKIVLRGRDQDNNTVVIRAQRSP